jgi:hypothetical protein
MVSCYTYVYAFLPSLLVLKMMHCQQCLWRLETQAHNCCWQTQRVHFGLITLATWGCVGLSAQNEDFHLS